MNKIEKILDACEKVLDGIETDNMSTLSVLLQCLRIARLSNDQKAIIWLQYEYGGYPKDETGHIIKNAWEIAYNSGRGYIHNGEKAIFTELASELEAERDTRNKAVSNFTTQGVSLSGEQALLAMNSLTNTVVRSTKVMMSSVTQIEKRLSILRARYYDYALKKQIEISFGNVATSIFEEYRDRVQNYFSDLSEDTIRKLQAIEDKINSDNPELYSQALTTCRRLFESTANELFSKHLPHYTDKYFVTKSGKNLDISGDCYKNRLSAVVETLEGKSPSKSIVGSNVIYLVDWIENLHDLQCKGVHSEITKYDAIRCIIQTYICLGDILSLQSDE